MTLTAPMGVGDTGARDVTFADSLQEGQCKCRFLSLELIMASVCSFRRAVTLLAIAGQESDSDPFSARHLLGRIRSVMTVP